MFQVSELISQTPKSILHILAVIGREAAKNGVMPPEVFEFSRFSGRGNMGPKDGRGFPNMNGGFANLVSESSSESESREN